MLGVLTAQEVGVVHNVLLGGMAAVGKNVGALVGIRSLGGPRAEKHEKKAYLEYLSSTAKDIANDEYGCGGV